MHARAFGRLGAALAGLAVTTMAFAGTAQAAGTGTIMVPGDMNFSETRATGHYEVDGSSLHIWTEGNSTTDKVAGYVATSTPLAGLGASSLEYTTNDGTIPPGYQLVVDFNNDGTSDGILVGEDVYNGDWWASNGSAQFVKDSAPSHAGGSGSDNHGTLAQWTSVFPDAKVTAFGFSLGSGVFGDYQITAINFNGTRYTFAKQVVLAGKDECKKGGWATSTSPAFKNQGDCVSYFASAK